MNVLVAVADLGLRALWEGILHDHGHRTLAVSADLPEWHEAYTFALDIAIVELTPAHPEALELCRRLRTGSPESGPAQTPISENPSSYSTSRARYSGWSGEIPRGRNRPFTSLPPSSYFLPRSFPQQQDAR
jgi:hypothetical protein